MLLGDLSFEANFRCLVLAECDKSQVEEGAKSVDCDAHRVGDANQVRDVGLVHRVVGAPCAAEGGGDNKYKVRQCSSARDGVAARGMQRELGTHGGRESEGEGEHEPEAVCRTCTYL